MSGTTAAGTTVLTRSVVSDELLLNRMCGREVEALNELYERYRRQAFALAYRIVANWEAAEEVTQDAFLSVWKQAQTYNARAGRVRPWLLSVVHHRAIDRVRRRCEQRLSPLDEAWMLPARDDVFRDVFRGFQRECIRRALTDLPGAQRHAIELAYFGGRTFGEIAALTEVPVGTVKSRVRLGLARLRASLDEEIA